MRPILRTGQTRDSFNELCKLIPLKLLKVFVQKLLPVLGGGVVNREPCHPLFEMSIEKNKAADTVVTGNGGKTTTDRVAEEAHG